MRVYVDPVWWSTRKEPAEVVSEAEWIRRIEAARAEQFVGGLTFDWCPTSCSATIVPQVIETPFGDGYKQRRPAGLRTQFAEWSLEFANRRFNPGHSIIQFLYARQGVDVFNWTPPRETRVRDVICPEYGWSYGELLVDGSRTITITAKFVEAYA
ncbi:phage tail protein [Paraburkholderia youngii]|uniref:phage tail protein n=1 Tax=Paraburkholderia youngii TaxID=2782701 RepID=UPI003D1BC81F